MPMLEIETPQGRVELAYLDEGAGRPVLLVHGFASTKEVNWLNTGWVKTLVGAGFRVVAFDNRGHGQSTKFHDKTAYSLGALAGDAAQLADALGLEQPHVVGYSMGARIASMLAIGHGNKFGRIALSGNGWGMVEGSGDWTPVEQALLAPSLDVVTDPRGRAFRAFADQTGSDLKALAACVAGVRELVPQEALGAIENDVLIAIGTDDDVAGSGEKLAAAIPGSRFFAIPGRDHMKAVGDKRHIAAVLEFLSAQ